MLPISGNPSVHGELAETADDRGTVNLLDGLTDGIEKDLWMFRAWKKDTAKSWS